MITRIAVCQTTQLDLAGDSVS